jgi:DNA-binding response OmpR family regulator
VRDLVADRAFVDCFDSADTTVDDIAILAPDLVVIDLKLGDTLAGWELLLACRAHPRLGRLPLVICSADSLGLREHDADLAAMPEVHVLQKPFRLSQFEEILRPMLETAV